MTNKNVLSKINKTSISLFDSTIVKNQNDEWVYDSQPKSCLSTGLILKGTLVGKRTQKFLKEIDRINKGNKSLLVHQILMSSVYAVELIQSNLITKSNLESLELKVTGAGRGMQPLYVLSQQGFNFGGKLFTADLVIVHSTSYDSFVFLDKDGVNL